MAADAVFLDAHGIVALLNAADWLHDDALKAFEDIGRRGRSVLTTNLVLAELGNGLARTSARRRAATFIRDALRQPRARVVFVDSELFRAGLDRYQGYADKEWGLVDCVSFELMTREGVQDAFTNDHHFEQAGFRLLLPRPR